MLKSKLYPLGRQTMSNGCFLQRLAKTGRWSVPLLQHWVQTKEPSWCPASGLGGPLIWLLHPWNKTKSKQDSISSDDSTYEMTKSKAPKKTISRKFSEKTTLPNLNQHMYICYWLLLIVIDSLRFQISVIAKTLMYGTNFPVLELLYMRANENKLSQKLD